MGILPLQFLPGQDVKWLHLSGEEIFAIRDTPGHRARYRCGEPPGNSAPTSNPKRDSSRFWRL